MFPGFDHIYYLGIAGRTFVGVVDLPVEACSAALEAEIAPTPPVIARWSMGPREPGDIISTTDGMSFIISDRLVSAMRPFTGWSTYDVQLIGRAGEVHPGYYGLSVHGRCGPIQKGRSVPMEIDTPSGRPMIGYRGMFFDETSWDGSDVFLSQGTALVFVTERVKLALEKARIKNLLFKRADLVEQI